MRKTIVVTDQLHADLKAGAKLRGQFLEAYVAHIVSVGLAHQRRRHASKAARQKPSGEVKP